jgi:succinate dehydrogenase/fumarate reductase flavoprotein subunit
MNENDIRWDEDFDLIVLGSGGAGLTAALVGAIENLKVLVLESSDYIGGTTAFSSGTLWVPGFSTIANDAQQASEAASQYLDNLVGSSAPKRLRDTFLIQGPRLLRYLAEKTYVQFRTYKQSPDYHQELKGASSGGQAHEPMPFDAAILGDDFSKIRWPIPELMLFGGMMVTRGEAAQLLKFYKSIPAAFLAIKLVSKYLRDRLSFKRGARVVIGNALVARLYYSLRKRDVQIRLNQRTAYLIKDESDRVVGVELNDGSGSRRLRATKGVILAGGGFPADSEWRERYFQKPVPEYTPACASSVGATMRLALEIGAQLGNAPFGPALWFPSSVSKRRDGSIAVYPHIVLDRSKPGLIAVNRSGCRFTNEAVSYHQFGENMHHANQSASAIPAALICDKRFIWKYGLGMIRPMTVNLTKYVANGYLKKADTIEELANQLDIDARALRSTINTYNSYAATGIDLEFHKGENIYDRSNGDPTNTPNPCIAAIDSSPYFSVLVYPTPLATSLGLATNEHAQVLSSEKRPIEGLYACGNDMNSIMGGRYPGPGAQLGPGMTFAFIAALHAASRSP